MESELDEEVELSEDDDSLDEDGELELDIFARQKLKTV